MVQKAGREDVVVVQLMGVVSEDLTVCETDSNWGFAMFYDDQSAFVAVGNRDQMERDITQRNDSLLLLVVDAIMNGADEAAQEMLEAAIGEQGGMIVNGERFMASDIDAAIEQRGLTD